MTEAREPGGGAFRVPAEEPEEDSSALCGVRQWSSVTV
jgi:hypothetical protein